MISIKKVTDSFYVKYAIYLLRHKIPSIIQGDEKIVRSRFKKNLGYEPNFDNPNTMPEKLNWLKLTDHRDFCTYVADKYQAKRYFADNFGAEYVVPLIRKFDSWKDITFDSLPDYPFIIKGNNGSGCWRIIKNKSEIDISELRNECRKWMYINRYYYSQEWQYKNVRPCIFIEKLLVDKEGRVPADLKFHYFNGELQFVYKVIDRQGANYRAFFSPEWTLLPFQWVAPNKYKVIDHPIEEQKPVHFEQMAEFGKRIAKNFNYVRVDFFDMGERFYFSEITLYHGNGFNRFYPEQYEQEYADKLSVIE